MKTRTQRAHALAAEKNRRRSRKLKDEVQRKKGGNEGKLCVVSCVCVYRARPCETTRRFLIFRRKFFARLLAITRHVRPNLRCLFSDFFFWVNVSLLGTRCWCSFATFITVASRVLELCHGVCSDTSRRAVTTVCTESLAPQLRRSFS